MFVPVFLTEIANRGLVVSFSELSVIVNGHFSLGNGKTPVIACFENSQITVKQTEGFKMNTCLWLLGVRQGKMGSSEANLETSPMIINSASLPVTSLFAKL